MRCGGRSRGEEYTSFVLLDLCLMRFPFLFLSDSACTSAASNNSSTDIPAAPSPRTSAIVSMSAAPFVRRSRATADLDCESWKISCKSINKLFISGNWTRNSDVMGNKLT